MRKRWCWPLSITNRTRWSASIARRTYSIFVTNAADHTVSVLDARSGAVLGTAAYPESRQALVMSRLLGCDAAG